MWQRDRERWYILLSYLGRCLSLVKSKFKYCPRDLTFGIWIPRCLSCVKFKVNSWTSHDFTYVGLSIITGGRGVTPLKYSIFNSIFERPVRVRVRVNLNPNPNFARWWDTNGYEWLVALVFGLGFVWPVLIVGQIRSSRNPNTDPRIWQCQIPPAGFDTMVPAGTYVKSGGRFLDLNIAIWRR